MLSLVSAASVIPGIAIAHDHLVPRVDLRLGGVIQDGGIDSAVWSDQAGDTCSTLQIDGTGEFPEALPVGPVTQRVAIRFRKRQGPRDVRISAWEAPPSTDQPAAEPESIAFALERGQGNVRLWRAVFDVEPGRHYYLHVHARWPDESGCGRQAIAKLFHLGP